MISWTPALSLGVAELDQQHQELFRRADAFVEGLAACAPPDVERLLAFLREYAEAHFGAEEDWMRAVGYPELEGHGAEHRRFLADLAGLADGQATARRTPVELAGWLVRWLHDHVVRADGAAARFALQRSGAAR